jgi:hypothetical protein
MYAFTINLFVSMLITLFSKSVPSKLISSISLPSKIMSMVAMDGSAEEKSWLSGPLRTTIVRTSCGSRISW